MNEYKHWNFRPLWEIKNIYKSQDFIVLFSRGQTVEEFLQELNYNKSHLETLQMFASVNGGATDTMRLDYERHAELVDYQEQVKTELGL